MKAVSPATPPAKKVRLNTAGNSAASPGKLARVGGVSRAAGETGEKKGSNRIADEKPTVARRSEKLKLVEASDNLGDVLENLLTDCDGIVVQILAVPVEVELINRGTKAEKPKCEILIKSGDCLSKIVFKGNSAHHALKTFGDLEGQWALLQHVSAEEFRGEVYLEPCQNFRVDGIDDDHVPQHLVGPAAEVFMDFQEVAKQKKHTRVHVTAKVRSVGASERLPGNGRFRTLLHLLNDQGELLKATWFSPKAITITKDVVVEIFNAACDPEYNNITLKECTIVRVTRQVTASEASRCRGVTPLVWAK